jgi:hypothetical protein
MSCTNLTIVVKLRWSVPFNDKVTFTKKKIDVDKSLYYKVHSFLRIVEMRRVNTSLVCSYHGNRVHVMLALSHHGSRLE